MTVGVLALQGDFAAHGAALERLGGALRWVRRSGDLEGLAGLVMPGGESTTMLKFLQQGDFEPRLREFARQRPVLATCAGAILLARRVRGPEQASLGLLDLTAVRNAYGRQLQSSIRSAEVAPAFQSALGARQLEAVLIRAPRFEELGPAVEVVAAIEGEPVLVRQGHLIAASFHPELSAESRVHRWFLNLLQSA